MKLGSMKAPWGDQVKGSWWKALLIVIVYFVLRVMFESWMYAQGALKVTAEPTLDMLQNPEFLGQVFQVTPVSYTHLTLPTILRSCRSRWSPYH